MLHNVLNRDWWRDHVALSAATNNVEADTTVSANIENISNSVCVSIITKYKTSDDY